MKRYWTTGDTSCCATLVRVLMLSVGEGMAGSKVWRTVVGVLWEVYINSCCSPGCSSTCL